MNLAGFSSPYRGSQFFGSSATVHCTPVIYARPFLSLPLKSSISQYPRPEIDYHGQLCDLSISTFSFCWFFLLSIHAARAAKEEKEEEEGEGLPLIEYSTSYL